MSRYIDKDKLLERMDDISAYYEEGREVKDEMIALVYDFLTADVEEVRHGEWEETKSGLEKCSICGKKGFGDWLYCPRCGAKMDGGEE